MYLRDYIFKSSEIGQEQAILRDKKSPLCDRICRHYKMKLKNEHAMIAMWARDAGKIIYL